MFNAILDPLSDWSSSQSAGMGFTESGAFTDSIGTIDGSMGLNMNQLDDMSQLWLWTPDHNAATDLFQS